MSSNTSSCHDAFGVAPRRPTRPLRIGTIGPCRARSSYPSLGRGIGPHPCPADDGLRVTRKPTEPGVDSQLADIVAKTDDGVVLVDTDGRLTYANVRAAEHLGRSLDALVGRDYRTALPE